MNIEQAIERFTGALTKTTRTLDDFGIVLSLSQILLDHATRHRPHLLRSKKRRQRNKAIGLLVRTIPRAERLLAFQRAAMAKIDKARETA